MTSGPVPRTGSARIATPNALHVPQALRCLRHRVPILLEKPVASRLTEAVLAAAGSGAPINLETTDSLTE